MIFRNFPNNQRKKKQPKYKNKKVECQGIKFDSKKERDRFLVLQQMEKNGEISNLQLQPKFVLQEGYRDRDNLWIRPITYIADFSYFMDNWEVVEDVKSVATAANDVYKIKKKMFVFLNPDIFFNEFI